MNAIRLGLAAAVLALGAAPLQAQERETQPAARSEAQLAEYAGQYGERVIRVRDGALYLQRMGGPELRLVPRENGEFGLNEVPHARIRFVREGGRVTAVEIFNQDRQWERVQREP